MTEKILTKQLKQVSTDGALGTSDSLLPTQKAVKTYVDVAISSTLPSSTKYAKSASLTINNTTYVVTLQLKDQDGNNLGSAQTIDLPLESVVVSGSYDADNKQIVLTLQDGSTIDIPVGDLISGLQTEITNDNKLSADLVDDSTSTNKFVTNGAATSIITNNLANARAVISDANGKIAASTTTSTEIGYLSGTTSSVQTQLNSKQATLVSGTNIKTINSGSILGSGNIDVLVNEATPASSLGIGYTTINTTYTDSINIGNGAQVGANNALALGAFASAEGQDSIAIYSSTGTAHRARTTHTGNIAIGYNALAINAAYTIAIGYNAYAQGANSIQLGTGSVALQNTFQVWTYPMLNKTSGLIPSARLADQTSATQGQALVLDANLDGQWTTLATVATSGSYNDLLNKPTLGTMAAESTSDYTPTSSLAAVATSGNYNDLSNTPTIPTTLAALTGDVSISTPTAGQVLMWDADNNVWKNTSSTASIAWGGITGNLADQTDLQYALDNIDCGTLS